MSHSRRKPYFTDQQGSKDAKRRKRLANKAIRLIDSDKEVPSGKQYRKYSESWNIRDWSFHAPNDKKAWRK